MALLSYAHITVAELAAYTGATSDSVEVISIYHDQSASATAATVAVASGTVTLTITGGANAGSDALAPGVVTIAGLAAAVNALGKGWVATVVNGADTALQSGLVAAPAADAFGSLATQYLAGGSDAGAEQAINQATEIVDAFLNTRAAAADYEEMYSGSGRKRLILRNRPIISVSRVAINVRYGVQIQNSGTDQQGATVTNDGTNLTLTIVGGANAGSDTVAIGSNTLTTVVSLINAVGKNWTASVDPEADGTWLAADLLEHEARAADLGGNLALLFPEELLEGYTLDAAAGILHRTVVTGRSAGPNQIRYRGGVHTNVDLPPLTAEKTTPLWPEGYLNVYVSYRSGYESIPDDIKYVTMTVAKNIQREGSRDTSLGSESVDGYSYSAVSGEDSGVLTASAKQRLGKYRKLISADYAKV